MILSGAFFQTRPNVSGFIASKKVSSCNKSSQFLQQFELLLIILLVHMFQVDNFIYNMNPVTILNFRDVVNYINSHICRSAASGTRIKDT